MLQKYSENIVAIRPLLFMMLLTAVLPVAAISDNNPFKQAVEVDIGNNISWSYHNKAATKSAPGEDKTTFYHLNFDQKQLRLHITSSAKDAETASKHYRQFAVNDILVDGKRLPVFHWCLHNQEQHSRFLQQGLSVKQDMCVNQGEKGMFVVRLGKSSLKMLQQGKKLTFVISPFRTQIHVNYDLSDFSSMATKLNENEQGLLVTKAGVTKAGAEKPKEMRMCEVVAPEEYAEIKKIEYNCADETAKAHAEETMNAQVEEEKESRAVITKIEAEQEKKRAELLAAKKRKEDARLLRAEIARMESATVPVSLIKDKKLDEVITKKMLVVCNKKWSIGQHRCFCEKYLKFAPPGIKSNPSCPI